MGVFFTSLQSTYSAARATLDHLVPIQRRGGSGAAYQRAWQQKLLVTRGDIARFVGLPGNVGEETSVSVHRRPDKNQGEAYWVTATQASGGIWKSIDGERSKRPPITVQRCDARLPESTALAIHGAWLAMLSEMRPAPKSESISLDSSTEIFSAVGSSGKLLEAQLSTAPGRNSLALLDIALSLMDYCARPPANRSEMAEKIEKMATDLIRRVSEKREPEA